MALGEHDAVTPLPVGVGRVIAQLLAIEDGVGLDQGERAAHMAIPTMLEHRKHVATDLGRKELDAPEFLLFH